MKAHPMSDQDTLVTDLQRLLPQAWQETTRELSEKLLQSDIPLRLTLVGGFSVGKSSLLNMLMGESLLQTALEESTALPTFIEHGAQRRMELIRTDGSVEKLDPEAFATATTCAPEQAACAVLYLPQDWLNGLSIIDLPGLGSLSAEHHAYTRAQISQADAVLYLLDPRGPTQSDLQTLADIRQQGKRVKVMVTRWDEVEASVARGEKCPSLEQWAAQIEAGCGGLRVRLVPCHRQGLGRDEVMEFLQRAKADLADIRTARFKAELKPLLDNALGSQAEARRTCEATSDEAVRVMHQTLMERKQTLSEFKAGLYAQQQQERQQAEQNSQAVRTRVRAGLSDGLRQQIRLLQDETGWVEFGRQGTRCLREALADLATQLSQTSTDHGQINLSPVQIEEFNLRLPTPVALEVGDLMDLARIKQIEQELARHQAEQANTESQLANLPGGQDSGEAEQHLQQMLLTRQQIAVQPLPRIVREVEPGGNGGAYGRMLGDLLDIGLLFVNPALIGTKVASVVGKGAKMAGMAVKASQVARQVSNGVQAAQAVQAGTRVAGFVPPPVMNKLGALEMLSFSYWGERIGNMFSAAPRTEEITDPQAKAEQAQAIAEVEARIQSLRREIHRQEDLANERQLGGWALEQSRKEQARLQADLAWHARQLEDKQREAEQSAQRERQATLERHAERAVAHWLRSFDQQAGSMSDVLHDHVRQHWEQRVDALVNERLADIEALSRQLQASDQDKHEVLAQLTREAEGLRMARERLDRTGA